MANLSQQDLFGKVADAFRDKGWQVLFVDANSQPLRIIVTKPNGHGEFSVYIWNLTPGGTPRSDDEFRIQVHVNEFNTALSMTTLVLGWSDEFGVFVGFDVNKHLGSLSRSQSIQVIRSAIEDAVVNGLATHDKGNKEIAVAFRPDLIDIYAFNAREIHELGTGAELGAIEAAASERAVSPEDLAKISEPRKQLVREVRSLARDAGFSRRVLGAYGNACAMCAVQLKLPVAAHIMPVADPRSTDETTNGVALCGTHHTAYDRGLVSITPEYQTKMSDPQLTKLKAQDLIRGLDTFMENLRPMIVLPADKRDYPSPDFIAMANSLRGW